jgi:unsaturated rhamnogalacturonyl hydrolase
MKSILLLLLAGATGLVQLAAADAPVVEKFGGSTPLEWSQRLARSEMARYGKNLEAGGTGFARGGKPGDAHWDYSPSVFALSLVKLGERTGDEAMVQYGIRAVASHVSAEGKISHYKLEDYSVDNVAPGRVLLMALERGEKNAAWAQATLTLRQQMATHPRTSEGGFWHKKRYPYQMWLDSMFMASSYLAEYAALNHEPALYDDVAKQIVLMNEHLYDPVTGLYWHGWDEKRAQAWANPKTGDSPSFWSRSIGWYGVGIVDILDYLPESHPQRAEIIGILHRVVDGFDRWQDPETGLWWQITDQGARPGNYLEASGSSMFVYVIAKAINHGYLPREKYEAIARKGYAGLIAHRIKLGANDSVSLTHIVEGVGLGYTMANGRPRDGTFEYYTSEPVADNDPKGTGPFILAGLEMQTLLAAPHP